MDGDEIEVVVDFNLLGSLVKHRHQLENKRRIDMGKSTMKSLDKVSLSHSLMFLVVTDGCESWTVKRQNRRQIDVFERWCWRRILSVPWTANGLKRQTEWISEQIDATLLMDCEHASFLLRTHNGEGTIIPEGRHDRTD